MTADKPTLRRTYVLPLLLRRRKTREDASGLGFSVQRATGMCSGGWCPACLLLYFLEQHGGLTYLQRTTQLRSCNMVPHSARAVPLFRPLLPRLAVFSLLSTPHRFPFSTRLCTFAAVDTAHGAPSRRWALRGRASARSGRPCICVRVTSLRCQSAFMCVSCART